MKQEKKVWTFNKVRPCKEQTQSPHGGSVVTPIYQTITYSIPNVQELLARYRHRKEGYGITENLVRASIGIEDLSDLDKDFKNALSHL